MSAQHRALLEEPEVPDLNEYDEVDLTALGDRNLMTYIKYTGMQDGDFVRPRWVGASPSGEAFDDVTAQFQVGPEDVANGLEVTIRNDRLRAAEGGWAFYSYQVNDGQESLRKFCYVGLRARTEPETLSVLHALPSHGLTLQPGALPLGGAVTMLVAPYQAMQVGDTITLQLLGYDEDGVEDDDWSRTLTVTKDHFDKIPLSADVPKSGLSFLEKGYMEGFYRIGLVDGGSVDSPLQRWEIDSKATLPDLLAAPRIEGHNEGDPLDPTQFRNGLAIAVPAYPGMQVSDHVVLHWRSPAGDLVQAARVDPSSLAAGSLFFRVPVENVMQNAGSSVRLSYLYGRKGGNLSSSELQVTVALIRSLPAADVRGAIPEGPADAGRIPGLEAKDGVYVVVPADTLAPGELAEVHWMGQSALGQYIAKEPVSPANPLRFFIPKDYVPANFGRGEKDESRRFQVFYRLIGATGQVDSAPYNLRITPVPSTSYPQITCTQADAGGLSLAKVPAAGADLALGTWLFGKQGQLLTVAVSGVTATGEVEEVILDSAPVTAEQAENGVRAKLPKAFLEGLTMGESFTISPRLSFDGGVYFTPFRSITLTLNR
ncbi:hypothetical protein HTV13_12340 [Pseudomonas putida]|uniref:hypothetical protein n=1 Tax=Pseudomonas putida TaxID=303 RepID=UPI00157333DF|nr:hypothetical protein [Pseudomonas putida]NSX20614.1 hypothetical protein [Pseudomonas putida]